jgi:hypothetical protein
MTASHVCEVCGPCWPLVCEVCGETDDLLNRPPMPGDRCFEHTVSRSTDDKHDDAQRFLNAAQHAVSVAIVAMGLLRDAVEPFRSVPYDDAVGELQAAEAALLRARARADL